MTGDSARDAYKLGQVAGAIDARLDGHDAHLGKINGSIDRSANELAGLREQVALLVLAVQRLGDAAEDDRGTVVRTAKNVKETAETTASALADAEQARRDRSENAWTPMQRGGMIIGAIVGILAILQKTGHLG